MEIYEVCCGATTHFTLKVHISKTGIEIELEKVFADYNYVIL